MFNTRDEVEDWFIRNMPILINTTRPSKHGKQFPFKSVHAGNTVIQHLTNKLCKDFNIEQNNEA
jgi:hypothetical protein